MFCACVDYHDPSHDAFYNRYFETCTETYFPCLTWQEDSPRTEDLSPSSDNYFNYTGYEMPTSLRRAFEIDRCSGTTLWQDAFVAECLLIRQHRNVHIRIDIDDPTILPLFSIKRHWRHKIRLCSSLTTFSVHDPFPGVGSSHQDLSLIHI